METAKDRISTAMASTLYTEIFKGDGMVFFGHLQEGQLVKLAHPSDKWNHCLKKYFAEIIALNPEAKVTINWTQSPRAYQETPGGTIIINGRFMVYDAHLYNQKGELI